MSKREPVLVDNGMAGIRTLEELLKLDPDQAVQGLPSR